jgi:hypothetical protein
MSVDDPHARYALLTATAEEEGKFDDCHAPQAKNVDVDVVAVEVRYDKVGKTPAVTRTRPRHDRRNLIIPGSVTVFEQDMLSLISTFSGTHSTEAGRYFVEHLSRVTDTADCATLNSSLAGCKPVGPSLAGCKPVGPSLAGCKPVGPSLAGCTTVGPVGPSLAASSSIIMWPTHEPDVMEIVNGDFCSDVNWIFAYCYKDQLGIVGCPISATIIGSLYPLSPSPNHSKLYTTVLFEKPDKYMRPMGETLVAAIAAYDKWKEYESRKDNRRFILRVSIGLGTLFSFYYAIFWFVFHG